MLKLAALFKEFWQPLSDWELVQNILERPDAEVRELFKLILAAKYESVENTKFSQIKGLKKEIERLKMRKDKLLDTLLDGVITNETFKERD